MSSSEAKTTGIAGISGKFAQCIIKSLLLNPSVQIKGYCRSISKLPTILTTRPRIKISTGSYDDKASIQNFVSNTSIVICCYFASTEVMTNGQKYLIDACETAKVPRYIAGDFSVDHTLIPSSRIQLFPKPTMKIIEYLSTKKTVKGVHILNGALMETFWAEFFQLYDSSSRTLSYWGTGDEKWEFTTYQTAADYTAAVALDENAVGIFRCMFFAVHFHFQFCFPLSKRTDKRNNSPRGSKISSRTSIHLSNRLLHSTSSQVSWIST